ncbi:MAG: hypothetical protein HYW34_00515 [Candidatus Brennerbacteria bacterium]|nr:hypothetical protein [Candidatus Brennerbacteria bacterium]
MIIRWKALIFLFLFLISFITFPLTGTAELLSSNESYFYIRRYMPSGTTEQLLYNRTGPTIKTEYGLKNRFGVPWQVKMNLDFILQGSIIGLTDPPEQWLMNLSFEKVFWKSLNLKIGHNRQYNISRGDAGSPKGFGLAGTFAEAGFILISDEPGHDMEVKVRGFSHQKSYLYARQYILDWTTEGLFYDRSGPILRNEYGLKNKFNFPLQTEFNINLALRSSSVKITDPPEQWLMNLSFEKEIWEDIIFKTGYEKQYDVSKSIHAPEESSEVSKMYFEIGFRFK